MNVRVGPYLVDFLWRPQRLIVETDGDRYHRGLLASAEDNSRDDHLRALGYEVLRFGSREVAKRPNAIASLLDGRLIGAGAPRTRPRRP